MRIDNFIRFAEVITLKEETKRVVSVTVTPKIADCTGAIYYTDLQLQEGTLVSGYTLCTEEMTDGSEQPLHWHNGVIRNGATIIIPNMGETSAPLDYYLYPNHSMDSEKMIVSQGAGGNAAVFRDAATPGDEFSLLATQHQCLRNGSPTPKYGFYQYSAAQDSKHPITLQERCSARLYVEYHETKEGAPNP
ncbi:hypothetical protein LJC74_04970 [Eubacteriales bacterium OttesenSCG-928-A19]|nr:hypothetical protein [Eubacteriales bacterium OttesenSCG-928-A19]